MSRNQKEKIMNKNIIFSILIVTLSACTSAPININYYALNTEISDSEEHSQNIVEKPLIVIEAIELAEFLRQQGIVVETDSNQLHMSSQHRWAERLDEALSRNLIVQLETKLPNYRFENAKVHWNKQPKYRANLSFSHFHSSINRQAVIAGRFWILNQENQLLTKQSFYLTRDLKKNGYSHAVNQLNLTLKELAQLLTESLQKLN